MNDVEQKFKNALSRIVMTPLEKKLMREDIISRSLYAPKKSTPSPWRTALTHFHFQYYVVAAAFILIVAGGVSTAADHALPGEPLYQVKTSVNENIRSLFTFTPESKAALHTELAVKRLEEAEQLAVSGKLDAAAQADVESNLNAHLAVVHDSIKQLQDQNKTSAASDTSSSVESSLNAHSAILNALARNDSQLLDVASKVQDAATTVSENGALIDSEVSSTTPSLNSVEDKQTSAEAALASVLTTLKITPSVEVATSTLGVATTTDTTAPEAVSMKVSDITVDAIITSTSTTALSDTSLASTSPDALSSLSATLAQKIASSTVYLQLGVEKMNDGSYGEAYVLFQKAERAAEEIKVLLQAQKDLNISLVSVPDDIVKGATAAVALSLPLNGLVATSTATSTVSVFATSTDASTASN